MICFKDVNFSFSLKEKLIENLSFCVEKGEILFIIGKNATGKSTLVKLLAGLLEFTGDIEVDGLSIKKDIVNLRKKVGFVFQDIESQFVSSIVEDDVRFSLENLGYELEEIEDRLDWVFSYLSIQDLRYRLIDTLSGGQKQKVAIAGVLALKPDYLVFDESFSMLDYESRENILQLIYSIAKDLNIGIIIISHFLDDLQLADKILYFPSKAKYQLYNGYKEFVKKNLKNYAILPYINKLIIQLKDMGCKDIDETMGYKEFLRLIELVKN